MPQFGYVFANSIHHPCHYYLEKSTKKPIFVHGVIDAKTIEKAKQFFSSHQEFISFVEVDAFVHTYFSFDRELDEEMERQFKECFPD